MTRMQGGIVTGVVCAAAAAMLMGGRALRAQPAAAATERYQYVGVGQTLARVETATGRIEILEQRNAPGLSLVHVQGRPWEWREIRVREGRRTRRASGEMPDESDRRGRRARP